MTVYFHADAAQLRATGTGYLLGQAHGPGASATATSTRRRSCGARPATLLATTHQVVYYKE